GQVWSKMRFASAQLMAYVEKGLWLQLAAASNAVAARIAGGIEAVPGLRLVAPVEVNELFLELPGAAIDALEREGFRLHRPSHPLRADRALPGRAGAGPADGRALALDILDLALAAGIARHRLFRVDAGPIGRFHAGPGLHRRTGRQRRSGRHLRHCRHLQLRV